MKVDVNKPLENPKLKELFKKLRAAKDEDGYVEVINELAEEIAMNAYFLSVISLSEEAEKQNDGTSVFKKDTTISFPLLTNQENKPFYPAFIDWEELYKWEEMKKEDLKTMILNFDDYIKMIIDDNGGEGMVINPFSDNFILDKDILKKWRMVKEAKLSGKTSYTVEEDTKVLIGTPKDYPTEMVEKISEYAKTEKRINSLWLRWMVKNGEGSYLLIADFKGDKDEIFSEIAKVATPFLKSGIYLDMLPYSDSFVKNVTKDEKPFYKKKFSLFS